MYIDKVLHHQLKQRYQDETVYVVPTAKMTHVPDKFHLNPSLDLAMYNALGKYVLRYDAEYNKAIQQIIPYVLIRNKKGQYYVAERLGGDTRFIGQRMLGFGGHIERQDGHITPIQNGLVRELSEELTLKNSSDPILLGTVRDIIHTDGDHTGFVFEMTVSSAKILEKDKLKGKWFSLDELVEYYFQFETWSKMIIDHLYETTLS